MIALSKLGITLTALPLLTLPFLVTCDDNDDREQLPLTQPKELSTSVSQFDSEHTAILEKISNIRSLACEAIYFAPAIGAVNTEIYLKGNKLTYEQMPGVTIIHDYEAGSHYVCDDSKNIAYRSALEDENRIPIFPYELENAIKVCDFSTVGTEILNGKSCFLLEHIDDMGICCKIWLSGDNGTPLRVTKSYSYNVVISLYDEFDINPELPDSLFELPAYFQVAER